MNDNNEFQPLLILLVGGIASGKSTMADALLSGYALEMRATPTVICPDRIREQISGDASDQSVNKQAWDAAYAYLDLAMRTHDKVVIFDAAYMVKDRTRKIMQDYARKYGYRVVYILLDTPVEQMKLANAARERRVPEDVLVRYALDFERAFPFIAKDKETNGEVQ